MTEAGTKLQNIRERVAELRKINPSQVFTPQQLQNRNKILSQKSLISYRMPQIQESSQPKHFIKSKQHSLEYNKPVFTLNTDFFRSQSLKDILKKGKIAQESHNQESVIGSNKLFEKESEHKQGDNRIVEQPESKLNLIKLHAVSMEPQISSKQMNQTKQQAVAHELKPVQIVTITKQNNGSSNLVTPNIFNTTLPINNLFNNSSASTSQSIFNLRTSINNSATPILFNNTQLLFNNANSLNLQAKSQATKQKHTQLNVSTEQSTITKVQQQKGAPLYEQASDSKNTKQTGQIKIPLFNNLNKTENDSKNDFAKSFSNPLLTNKQSPQKASFLFGQGTDNKLFTGVVQPIKSSIFQNNKGLFSTEFSKPNQVFAIKANPTVNTQKATLGISLFSQSSTSAVPFFGSIAKNASSVLNSSETNVKQFLQNAQPTFLFNNVQKAQKQQQNVLPSINKQKQSLDVKGTQAKSTIDRPFVQIKLTANPPSPPTSLQQKQIPRHISPNTQYQQNISPQKQQVHSSQPVLVSESEHNSKQLATQTVSFFNKQTNKNTSQSNELSSSLFSKQTSYTAIGPGGKKIQVPSKPSFFSFAEKPFLGGQVSNESSLFGSPIKNTSIIFTGGLTSQTNGGLFSSASGASLFAKQLFAGSNSANNNIGLFGNLETSIFNVNNKEAIPEGEGNQEDEEGEDGPIEAQDTANPQLSTGSYDYIKTQVFFKEPANKFRVGTKDVIENVVVSVQKFIDKPDKYVYVRMSNKCIAFTGKIIPGITQIRSLNNNNKNVQIKKILLVKQQTAKPELVLIKIQFKEESKGEKLIKEVAQGSSSLIS